MCGIKKAIYTVSHEDLAQAGIFIDANGVNIPLDNLNAVVAVREFANAVRKAARERKEAIEAQRAMSESDTDGKLGTK